MSHDAYLGHQVRNQNFAWGLRQEMGYPLFAPANDCTAFAGGAVPDIAYSMEICCIASAMRKDIIYLGWSHVDDAEPSGIAVALRDMLHVDWIDRLFPWAADAASPIVLVSTRRDEHIAVGARGLLEQRVGKPAKALGKGKRLAMQRIRRAAATMGDELAANNIHLPRGSEWQEPPRSSGETIVRFG